MPPKCFRCGTYHGRKEDCPEEDPDPVTVPIENVINVIVSLFSVAEEAIGGTFYDVFELVLKKYGE